MYFGSKITFVNLQRSNKIVTHQVPFQGIWFDVWNCMPIYSVGIFWWGCVFGGTPYLTKRCAVHIYIWIFLWSLFAVHFALCRSIFNSEQWSPISINLLSIELPTGNQAIAKSHFHCESELSVISWHLPIKASITPPNYSRPILKKLHNWLSWLTLGTIT